MPVDTTAWKPRQTLLYELNDRLPHGEAALVGLQHALAMFIGVVTPPMVIARAVGLPAADAAYLVSMGLFVSGLSTWLQVRTWARSARAC